MNSSKAKLFHLSEGIYESVFPLFSCVRELTLQNKGEKRDPVVGHHPRTWKVRILRLSFCASVPPLYNGGNSTTRGDFSRRNALKIVWCSDTVIIGL